MLLLSVFVMDNILETLQKFEENSLQYKKQL